MHVTERKIFHLTLTRATGENDVRRNIGNRTRKSRTDARRGLIISKATESYGSIVAAGRRDEFADVSENG